LKKDFDISNDKKALYRLKVQCEIAKRALSEAFETSIELDSLYDGNDYNETISRAFFEELNEDLFQKTIEIVGLALEDSKLTKEDISDIILIGGSSRIPKIKNLLEEFFDNKKIYQNINADEAVAYGAALQAALLSKKNHPELSGLQIVEVSPLSLGIEIKGNIMSKIIKKNTRIPASKSSCFTTTVDDQESIIIKVFEGERSFCKDNHLLGEFLLENIKKAPMGEPQITVTFSIDNDSILHVKACDNDTKSTGYYYYYFFLSYELWELI
jgi:molecular chaperone DnaK (HSP70)